MNSKKAFSLIELSIVVLVIGILIAGVIHGTKLYYKFKLVAARSLTQNSDVASIKDLVVWVDTTQEGVMLNSSNSSDLVDGDAVKSWAERNPQAQNPFVFIQTSSTRYPTFRESAINGLPALEFEGPTGTGDNLYVITDPRIENPKDFSIYAVFTPLVGNTYTGAIGILAKDNGTTPSGLVVNNSPYGLYFNSIGMTSGSNVIDENGSTTSTTIGWNTASYGFPTIAGVIHDSINTSLSFKGYNKGTVDSTPANSSTTLAATSGDLNIGVTKVGAENYYFKGYISEIIMFNRAITAEERKAVEKYLSKKWGIKLSY